MKYNLIEGIVDFFKVTSLAEVWIEIIMRMDGCPEITVTSLAEVWIEIVDIKTVDIPYQVTSLAEVWIEIIPVCGVYENTESLPLRKCGLK